MTAGIKHFLTLLLAMLWVNGACAQTYNQMTWGFTLPSGSPYSFGANIQGNWYNLGTVSSAGIWSIPSSNLSFTQSGTGAVSQTVSAKLNHYIDMDDYKSTSDTSDCDALTKAIAANTGAVIRLPPRQVNLGTASIACNITISTEVIIQGSGWQETTESGTVLYIQNTSGNPFTITGNASRGTTFRNLSIYQAHPAPTSGWAPTAYPAVFNVSDTNGEVRFENILAFNVYQFMTAISAGQLYLNSIRGQVFNNFLTLDKAYDTVYINDIHLWPYWSSNLSVTSYQQANMNAFVFYRADSPFVNNVFVYGALRGFQFGTSVWGVTSKFAAGLITCDFTTYCIDSTGNNVTGHIDALKPDGQNVASPGTGVAGARGIRIGGLSAFWDINSFETTYYDTEAIELASGSRGITLKMNAVRCNLYNLSNSGAGCEKDLGTANNVYFAQQPQLINGNGTSLATTGVPPSLNVQRNSVTNMANFALALDAITGNPVTYTAAGQATNINLSVAAKGAGTVIVGPNFSSPGASTFGGAIYVGATPGVSCSAGTVNTTTMVITNGIVTHC